MNRLSYFCALLLLAALPSFAGGNSSLVKLERIHSIKIEENRVLITGDGMVSKRVLSNKEHGDGTVFGQPAQWQHSKVTACSFVLVPYGSRDDIAGVPGPSADNLTPEMKAMSKRQWQHVTDVAKALHAGDAATIGYQLDRTVITGFQITRIIGAGSLTREDPAAGPEGK